MCIVLLKIILENDLFKVSTIYIYLLSTKNLFTPKLLLISYYTINVYIDEKKNQYHFVQNRKSVKKHQLIVKNKYLEPVKLNYSIEYVLETTVYTPVVIDIFKFAQNNNNITWNSSKIWMHQRFKYDAWLQKNDQLSATWCYNN